MNAISKWVILAVIIAQGRVIAQARFAGYVTPTPSVVSPTKFLEEIVSQLVTNCPRCGAKKITFDVLSVIGIGVEYDWKNHWEVFCRCGHCLKSSIFHLSAQNLQASNSVKAVGGLTHVGGSINRFINVERYISVSDVAAIAPPESLPADVLSAFNEGAKCMTVGCYNAAGTMFRLCVDMTTANMLPEGSENGLNYKTRRDLGLRLPWLFENRYLTEDLQELSTCIREDGNDGAHRGTLSKEDAFDLLDFTVALLTRIYTEPEKLRLAKERREARRAT